MKQSRIYGIVFILSLLVATWMKIDQYSILLGFLGFSTIMILDTIEDNAIEEIQITTRRVEDEFDNQ